MNDNLKKSIPEISIIMPTYNRAYILKNAINSVIKQTYKNWELIIVDDGSCDGTQQRVSKIKDNRIRFIRLDCNRGANYARNIGLKEAKGNYIAFIDSDNQWHNDYLEKQIDIFQNSDEDIDVVFAKTEIINHNTHSIFPCKSANELGTPKEIISYAVLESVFDTNVICMKKRVWEKSGGFNETLHRLQDWEYYLRLLLCGKYNFKFNDNILATNYVQKDSISNQDNLFWEARLYILEECIEYGRKINMVVEIMFWLIRNGIIVNILPNQAEKLFSLLNAEEKEKFCKRYYKDYIEYIESINSFTKNLNKFYSLTMKNNQIITVQEKWLSVLIHGGTIVDYFYSNHVRSIGIYGFGVLGKLLWQELEKSDIKVKFIIDNNAKFENIEIHKLEEIDKFDVDEIVVTAVAAFEQIKQCLYKKTDVKIISIKEIINEL